MVNYHQRGGEDYDEWRARKEREAAQAAALQGDGTISRDEFRQLRAEIVRSFNDLARHSGVEFAAERDAMKAEIAEATAAMKRAVELRVAQQVAESRSADRAERVRLQREIEKLRDEIEELRQLIAERGLRAVK
ncbi:hypothetical protein GOC53_14880 [Sinorhizobium medicae]|uniref:hypothetical protein n=1 Tax=Rhizobium meliloti TaxID=382 RepID=UPI000B4A1C05|nr:hypothetical protein [Sinorhizobium meliloti]ASP51470.1 hypothetical protein CDO31_07735 [Sinorhizobium meliloti]MDX0491546.1 hypothetical protein [Sinorhizobium medicae]